MNRGTNVSKPSQSWGTVQTLLRGGILAVVLSIAPASNAADCDVETPEGRIPCPPVMEPFGDRPLSE